LRFGAGLLVPLQGAAARCGCQIAVCALELPGAVLSRASFLFPSLFSGPEEPWWVGMPLGLGLVLAAFLFSYATLAVVL